MTSTSTIPRPISEIIMYSACKYFDCSQEDLCTSKYKQQKRIVIYLLREHAVMSFSKIGKRFKYTDSSGPRRVHSQVDREKDIYAHIRHDIRNIEQIIQSSM